MLSCGSVSNDSTHRAASQDTLQHVTGTPSASRVVVVLLFLACDCLSAWLLYRLAQRVVARAAVAPDAAAYGCPAELPGGRALLPLAPTLCLALYLFHPYGWLSFGARSLVLLHNTALLAALYGGVTERPVVAAAAAALAAYLSLFPVLLVLPLALMMPPARRVWFAAAFVAAAAALLAASVVLEGGSWLFVRRVYVFTLLVEDLTPNIGLFW